MMSIVQSVIAFCAVSDEDAVFSLRDFHLILSSNQSIVDKSVAFSGMDFNEEFWLYTMVDFSEIKNRIEEEVLNREAEEEYRDALEGELENGQVSEDRRLELYEEVTENVYSYNSYRNPHKFTDLTCDFLMEYNLCAFDFAENDQDVNQVYIFNSPQFNMLELQMSREDFDYDCETTCLPIPDVSATHRHDPIRHVNQW